MLTKTKVVWFFFFLCIELIDYFALLTRQSFFLFSEQKQAWKRSLPKRQQNTKKRKRL